MGVRVHRFKQPQLQAEALAKRLREIDSAVQGSAQKATGSFLDKTVPLVGDRQAFRQYGEALLRTNSTDRRLVRTRMGEWVGQARTLHLSDPAINELVGKLGRRLNPY
jgi:hypothetical protein